MKAIKLIAKFKLSIVIPIYNSEKTLKNCLNSICKQRKKQSIEIIKNSKHSSLFDKILNLVY